MLRRINDYNVETQTEVLLGYEKIENIVDIDLRKYCSCYLPISEITDWGAFEYYYSNGKSTPSNNIIETANDLVKEIDQFTVGVSDVVALSEFVTKTIHSIDAEIDKIKLASSPNEVYTAVLSDFLSICSSGLYRDYSKRH